MASFRFAYSHCFTVFEYLSSEFIIANLVIHEVSLFSDFGPSGISAISTVWRLFSLRVENVVINQALYYRIIVTTILFRSYLSKQLI